MDRLKKIALYFNEEHHYKKAIGVLRELALSTAVEETYKWQFPTYTVGGKNVFAICKFNNHFGIWFFNGAFLKDPKQVLQNAQEGKTIAMRQWKFQKEGEIDKKIVLGYYKEAIENQKQGKTLVTTEKRRRAIVIPQLLSEALENNKALKTSFKNLTPYKQNEYCEYIQTAKQEKTKIKRLEKCIPLLIKGKGLNDKYRN